MAWMGAFTLLTHQQPPQILHDPRLCLNPTPIHTALWERIKCCQMWTSRGSVSVFWVCVKDV